jgi:undecaprenyl-diphosphatase
MQPARQHKTGKFGTAMRVKNALSRTLLLGVAIAIAFAAGLAWLATEVIGGDTLQFDMAARNAIHSLATPALTAAMIVASAIGESYVLLPLSAAIVFAFWRSGHRHPAILFTIAMTGGLLVDEALKLSFRRARPQPFFDYPLPHSYSFPSGHALFSVVFFGTLAALISPGLRVKWKKALLWAAAALLAAVIGYSRIYLGVHYATDVIAGYAAALVWVLAVAIGSHVLRQ